jgi:hypothetical protein
MRKIFKLNSYSDEYGGSKKLERGYGGVCRGVWRSLRFVVESGVRRSVLCWHVWQESRLNNREGVFTFNLI